MKIAVKPALLVWARERAGQLIDDLRKDFPKIEKWEAGEDVPTLAQLEKFAKKVHVPIGYLFLDAPPDEAMPIQDFRTLGSHGRRSISVNARDMIYLCQRRQNWYRDYALANGFDKINFVGSKTLQDNAAGAAAGLRGLLQLGFAEQHTALPPADFLRILRERLEEAGILVMISGIVGSNTSRALNIREFRGFALADAYAPLIFVNGKDADTGKIFTLAHELGHICLGETGISDADCQNKNEKWCNDFAAEFLVPLGALKNAFRGQAETDTEIGRLAKYFKVSSIVIAQRLRDAALISDAEYEKQWRIYNAQQPKTENKEKSTGGDYYKTQPVRVSKRFLRALAVSAVEGQTLYRDALRLAGVNSIKTFEELAAKIKAA